MCNRLVHNQVHAQTAHQCAWELMPSPSIGKKAVKYHIHMRTHIHIHTHRHIQLDP